MSYIFIEKKKHESKTIKEILLEIIDGVVQARDDYILKVDDMNIRYRIIQKKKSTRCYLEMVSKGKANCCISALQKVDETLFKSSMQKYYHAIRDYDGISESFCKRLYPKYAEFERKLRGFILFILTEAYGGDWKKKTVSDELLDKIEKNAHGKVSLNEILENMDLNMLEIYLFEKNVDYSKIISEKLSPERLEKLEKAEICSVIEEMKPTSLWERNFETYGSQKDWEDKISKIHIARNKVAHQKTIRIEEFNEVDRKLNKVNSNLTSIIEKIRDNNFTEDSKADILASFNALTEQLSKIANQLRISQKVMIDFSNNISESLKPLAEALNNLNSEIAQSVMVKSLSTISENFASFKNLEGIEMSAKVFSDTDEMSSTTSNHDNGEQFCNEVNES